MHLLFDRLSATTLKTRQRQRSYVHTFLRSPSVRRTQDRLGVTNENVRNVNVSFIQYDRRSLAYSPTSRRRQAPRTTKTVDIKRRHDASKTSLFHARVTSPQNKYTYDDIVGILYADQPRHYLNLHTYPSRFENPSAEFAFRNDDHWQKLSSHDTPRGPTELCGAKSHFHHQKTRLRCFNSHTIPSVCYSKGFHSEKRANG